MSEFYSFTTQYGAADEFFQAVMSLDKPRVEQLKAQGVTLTENVKQTLISGGGSMVSNKPAAPFWYLYLSDLAGVSKETFVYISRTFFEETGEPLYYSESLVSVIGKYYYNSAVFICLMECYNLKKMNKKKTMQEIIRKNRIDLLEVCVKCGWLSQTKKRDELIEYAQMNNHVECTAWLMDFKNRTADLAAEREKADKKLMRELNADPNSVSELSKIWSYKKQEDGTLIITSFKGSSTVAAIPEKIGRQTVTAIGDYACSPFQPRAVEKITQLRKHLTKLTIPNTVTSIGKMVFQNCISLEEVNIPDGITVIKNGTFSGCEKLKSIKIPDSVKIIEPFAFCRCESLPEIIIPDGVTEIGYTAFAVCRLFKSVELPQSVQEIGLRAFSNCNNLEHIKLPHGITEIKMYTFEDCDKLQSIEIPDTVESIGEGAFNGCKSLKSVEIPESVTTIGKLAFSYCDKLETVKIPASVKQIKNQTSKGKKPQTVFHDSPNVTAVVEPKSYAEKYCIKHNIPYKHKEDV